MFGNKIIRPKYLLEFYGTFFSSVKGKKIIYQFNLILFLRCQETKTKPKQIQQQRQILQQPTLLRELEPPLYLKVRVKSRLVMELMRGLTKNVRVRKRRISNSVRRMIIQKPTEKQIMNYDMKHRHESNVDDYIYI